MEFLCVSDGSLIQASFLLANHFHLRACAAQSFLLLLLLLYDVKKEKVTQGRVFLIIECSSVLCLVKNSSYAGKGVILSWSSCAGRCSGLFLDVLIQPLIANGMCLFLIVSP